MTRVLVVEDDPLIGRFLKRGLRSQGWSVLLVDEGSTATDLAVTGSFDVIVLDMQLPDMQGYHVLQDLRAAGDSTPVLILTGMPELRDAVECLDAGADDYMTKPFRLEELLARLRARLRVEGARESHVIVHGELRLDLWTREATVRDCKVALTSREFMLLETLLRHPGQVLSREQLLSQVWGFDFEPDTNVVSVFVSSLRKKLGLGVIETVRGFGYRLAG